MGKTSAQPKNIFKYFSFVGMRQLPFSKYTLLIRPLAVQNIYRHNDRNHYNLFLFTKHIHFLLIKLSYDFFLKAVSFRYMLNLPPRSLIAGVNNFVFGDTSSFQCIEELRYVYIEQYTDNDRQSLSVARMAF